MDKENIEEVKENKAKEKAIIQKLREIFEIKVEKSWSSEK